jgi:hypothetical protein
MVFDEVFERFVESCPAAVMHRALMERVFAPAKLDAIFHRAAKAQYERELLFSTLVDLTSQVVCRISKSVHAAFVRQREQISVSVRSLYDKLSHVEPCTSESLVRSMAGEIRGIIDRVKGRCKPLLAGYRLRVLDGNHLGKTHHRLGVLRGTAAGALPGQALAVLDPQYMLIDEIVCCEDGHAQERSLLDKLDIRRGDLIIDDRNFCTLGFLFSIKARKACFITRQHARMPWTPSGKSQYIGRCSTGRVYEQKIEIREPNTGEVTHIRRITVKLGTPTRDGDTEIHLLSNLPAKITALKIAELYRKRWTLEQAFNELTTHLRCELNTLGYPKAALFAFSVAVCSYNLLAAVKGALRGVHGEQVLTAEVSNFFLTDEINGTYRGMMVALPPENWTAFQTMNLAAFAAQLRHWARATRLDNYPKHPRGPKKPKPKLANAQFQHVATAKLLDEQSLRKKRKLKKPSTPSP